MGWTYTQLDEQPTDMIEYTLAFINAERKEQERRQKSAKSKSKKGGAVR